MEFTLGSNVGQRNQQQSATIRSRLEMPRTLPRGSVDS
jgi:hypothetical protein